MCHISQHQSLGTNWPDRESQHANVVNEVILHHSDFDSLNEVNHLCFVILFNVSHNTKVTDINLHMQLLI